MNEIWVVSERFPSYSVSDLGRVVNNSTGKVVKPSITSSGLVKIGLMSAGKQRTTSLALLVAETFVEGRNEQFNTPIQLNGNPADNRAVNLVWRPRYFAWRYTRQFHESFGGNTNVKVIDEAGRIYRNMEEAATTNGLLTFDVYMSVYSGKPTFPTGQVFKIH